MVSLNPPTDEELTRRAQAGETAALGLLLARHQAPMRAVALSLLGYGPDAEDAVQDAALTALRRIGDVRDPSAVGAWLRAIVRNASRTRLRETRETPGLDGLDHLRLREQAPSQPERLIEEHAMRDWIWDAVDELPPQLRLVLMLRHFSGVTSYREIAAVCEVPVGTVRSRLNQARGKMAQVLLSTAARTHDDASALAKESRHEAVETLQASERGALPREISELWPAETELVGPLSRPGERTHPVPVMRHMLECGVRQYLRHVVASRDITIWEMDVTNPIGVTNPCPPTIAWLMFREKGRVQRLRLIFPEPSR
ncbi:RNA polymerase sigma factor [Streptomyces sp. NBC_01356]|uniref:RNA polymerase sigma factor n=1 Tax=Streptomyces sp. NBC_01356 TaxID=2903836 RepID=UPI002E328205|nr:RNA polymerase sigma factor [Streptomyces sp. NBC_01356]